jgi:itaconate CoA-transferase
MTNNSQRDLPTVCDPESSNETLRLPLDGLRVVSLEQAVAGPLCSRHLADLGADVIKVENPNGGDLARHYDSVVHGQSAYFVWANRGKRSVALDLKSAAGLTTLRALLDDADIFVHNLGPGAVDRLGLGRDAVSSSWPRLVNCAISGYGSDGPYGDRKAFDLLVQGEAGLLSVTGMPNEPAKVGISIADISAALYAFSAVLAALFDRKRTGTGRFIDISLLDSLAEWMMAPTYHQMYRGQQPARAGARHNMIAPYGVYRVGSDEYVNFAVQTETQWRDLCVQVLRRPTLVEDQRFSSNEVRVRNSSALEAVIESGLSAMTAREVEKLLRGADIPAGAVNNLADLMDHPQLRDRDRWIQVDSPGGKVAALRSPFNISGLQERSGAVPALGEHTDIVIAELRESQQRGQKG